MNPVFLSSLNRRWCVYGRWAKIFRQNKQPLCILRVFLQDFCIEEATACFDVEFSDLTVQGLVISATKTF